MAINQMNFRSEVLGMMVSVAMYIPDNFQSDYPVIYLLHGRSDDCNTWLNATSLARYATEYPFIIVMPEVGLSYYTDMVHGQNYWKYLTQELPQKIKQWYCITTEPKETFVAGLSMGGYGAFKWSMQKPESFGGAASLSGALDVVSLWERDTSRNKEFTTIFGNLNQLKESTDNLFNLFENEKRLNFPHFLQICGTEDFLYQDNQKFRRQAEKYFENFDYIEAEGTHDWLFWDTMIQKVLIYFSQLLTNK